MKIEIDKDPNLIYENTNCVENIIKTPFIFILNNIPSRLRGFIKKTNRSAKKIIEEATTHGAIEVLYKFGEPGTAKTFLQKLFHYIWFATDNPKAVRNRLKLVTREVKNAIKRNIAEGRKTKILSIAAGSARAILDAVMLDDLLKRDEVAQVTFLDKNPEANKYSQLMVSERVYPEKYKFKWITDTASTFPTHLSGEDTPNIIEIVGLLDYFDSQAVERIFRLVYNNLEKDGVFITSNIVDNRERKFVTNVVGWDMIYKKPEEFFEIATRVGFSPGNIRILYEPFKIHFVMIAKK